MSLTIGSAKRTVISAILILTAWVLLPSTTSPSTQPNTTRPIPSESIERQRPRTNHDLDSAERDASPVVTKENREPANNPSGLQEHPHESDSVVGDVSVSRDWRDNFTIVLSALLVLVTYLQLRLMYWTYVADHRPRLSVYYVALITKPDDLLQADERGALRAVPVEVSVILTNQGNSGSKIVEGNISLKVVGTDSLQDILRRTALLPAAHPLEGSPIYDPDRSVLVGYKIKPHERLLVPKAMPVPESVAESVRPYLAIHPQRHLEHTALFAFGYFKYRDWTFRRYTTAFCRRYDATKSEFVPVDNPYYEYQD